MNKTQKLINALEQGKELTAKQIASRFKVSNHYDLIYKARQSGVNVQAYNYNKTQKVKYSV